MRGRGLGLGLSTMRQGSAWSVVQLPRHARSLNGIETVESGVQSRSLRAK